ncbi:MAG: DUF3137 domain-containing protein [Candidatus Izemoplasmatales bacterium]|jgi:hypothetical protein|nr:DUF3137 domain-containing protein [Candidatus Izemoplasmatales bacterium]
MQQKLDRFNNMKKGSERISLIGFIIIGIGAILLLAVYLNGGENGMVFPIIILAVGFIVSLVGTAKFSQVKRSFKNDVLSEYFQDAIPGVKYYPINGLAQTEVYATEFLKRADRFHSEDLLEGQMDEVDFISSDVRLEERHVQHTKNGTRVYYVTYFLGRVFKFTFNKEFDGYLQVLESGSPLSNRKFQKVELESIDFNKKFRTYSTNELSAFYVLTPDIMEAIFELEKRNPGRISLSFTGENLYIAINNNKDTFEIKMFSKIDQQIMDEFKRDLLVIKDFVHTLKLNTKIFKSKIGHL